LFYQVELDRDFFLKRHGEGGGLIPIRVELLSVLLGTVLPLGFEKNNPIHIHCIPQGHIQGGARGARPPLKLEKIYDFFGVKS
jgi:hypothetical protein